MYSLVESLVRLDDSSFWSTGYIGHTSVVSKSEMCNQIHWRKQSTHHIITTFNFEWLTTVTIPEKNEKKGATRVFDQTLYSQKGPKWKLAQVFNFQKGTLGWRIDYQKTAVYTKLRFMAILKTVRQHRTFSKVEAS